MIASATWKLALTTIVPAVFGSRCRTIVRVRPEPIALATCTNSRARNDSVSPRIRRAGPSQENSAITPISSGTVG
jgi:hypothetical protein